MNEDTMKQIMEAVARMHSFAAETISHSKCDCGSNWNPRPSSQSLGYDPEEKCMCDSLTFSCPKCNNTKQVKMPLRGGPYAKMAEQYKKKDSE